MDGGFVNNLPSGNFASLPGSGKSPGIIFSGEFSPNFGDNDGKASVTNWQVGGSSSLTREVFTDTHNLIPTSYNFLLETAKGSGITPKTVTSIDADTRTFHGIYQVKGDLSLTAPLTFGTGNFIILVDGNLNINANVVVPLGSTVIFSVSGDINIEPNVTSLEGLYSADEDLTVKSKSNCASSIADTQLTVKGTFVANAGRKAIKGIFNNQRTLCSNNNTYPSISFVERPDFMINYPSMVKQIIRAWQDVAP